MAKATKTKQKELGDWTDKPPKPVQEAADEYERQLLAFGRAKERIHTAKDNAIAAMKKHGVKRLVIRDGQKVLMLDAKDTLKIAKRKLDENGQPRRRGRPSKEDAPVGAADVFGEAKE